MKKTIIALLLFLFSIPAFASQYYLSPTGSDSNNGTTVSTPWLSPNHALNCGDIITAASGTYNATNFYQGKWGTVTCSAGGVAWLQCATFDTCKISATSSQAMFVSASYWGVSGWEATDSWTYGNCFYTQTEGGQSVHHVIFANDVAINCVGGGFVAYNSGGAASDYYAWVGDIAYGTGLGTPVCASGFSMGFLKQLDANAGTHLYVADTYGWNNKNPTTCASTSATDGEGLIFDTLNSTGFTGQAVAENNIYVFNYGRGIEVNNNTAAHIIFSHNTTYGNNQQAGQQFPSNNGELYINEAGNVTATGNLAMTNQGTTGGSAIFAASITGSISGISVNNNWLFSAAGNTTQGPGGDFSSNITTTNPSFSAPTIPGQPNCTGTANVTACVAAVIAAFQPTASGAASYGYQPVSSTSVVNANFPAWLCNGNALIAGFPAGLITPGCGGSSATLVGVAITGSTNVAVGSTSVLTATGTYSNGTTANLTSVSTWSSSNTAVCTVTTSGVVTGVSLGSCTITAVDSSVHAPGYIITVGSPTLVSLAITGTQALIAGGPQSQLIGTGTYSDGSKAVVTFQSVWSSSNTAVCTVTTPAAVVTPVAVGTCIITAVNGTITNSPTFTVTITAASLTSITIASNNGSNTVTIGSTQQFTATGVYTNLSKQNVTASATWTSAQPSICTVSLGIATGVAAGTCNITATYSGHSNTPLGVQAVVAGPGKSTFKGFVVIGGFLQ